MPGVVFLTGRVPWKIIPPNRGWPLRFSRGFWEASGVHRFYLGKAGTGILMIITVGGAGIWWLIDFIMAVSGAMKDKEGRPIKNW